MELDLQKYKDIFGKPGTGVHSYRIFGLAAVDIFATVLGAFIIWKISGYKSFWIVLATVFLLGIILHRIFGVKTTVDVFLRKYII